MRDGAAVLGGLGGRGGGATDTQISFQLRLNSGFPSDHTAARAICAPRHAACVCDIPRADDVFWYPLLLAEKSFVGLFAFREKELLWHTLQPLSDVADAPLEPLMLLGQ